MKIIAIDFLYVFSRFCAFYSMTDEQVLRMPVKRFWAMSACINRIQAERDKRKLSVTLQTNGNKNSIGDFVANLDKEMGEVAVYDRMSARADKEGIAKLKKIASG
jgi:hypothetical protein